MNNKIDYKTLSAKKKKLYSFIIKKGGFPAFVEKTGLSMQNLSNIFSQKRTAAYRITPYIYLAIDRTFPRAFKPDDIIE